MKTASRFGHQAEPFVTSCEGLRNLQRFAVDLYIPIHGFSDTANGRAIDQVGEAIEISSGYCWVTRLLCRMRDVVSVQLAVWVNHAEVCVRETGDRSLDHY